jgi:uncharacterized membrane protein
MMHAISNVIWQLTFTVYGKRLMIIGVAPTEK